MGSYPFGDALLDQIKPSCTPSGVTRDDDGLTDAAKDEHSERIIMGGLYCIRK